MSVVIWTKPALNDIEQLISYLLEVNPEVAQQIAQSIRKAGDSLSSNPKRGVMVQDVNGVRKLRVPFGRSSFVIHYAVLDDEVVILRVYHGRQNRPT
jgi:plasmid stabilization system protein ParE